MQDTWVTVILAMIIFNSLVLCIPDDNIPIPTTTSAKSTEPMPFMPPFDDYANKKKAIGPQQSYVKYETNLLQDIIGNYSSGMRPVMSSKKAAVVHFDLRLKKLVKLDMKQQVLVLEAFVLMRWHDPQVQWDVDSYNGTDLVNIPSKSIWTPDVELYNNAKDLTTISFFTAPVIATSNGSIVWTNQVKLHASCDVDITWFPLDVQRCPLTFGSWSYSHKRLKIVPYRKMTEMSDMMEEGRMFVTNGVWINKNIVSVLSLKKYSCCEDPFSQIEYSFQLKRRPTFFLLYLIFPCVAIVTLSLLTFIIPPEAGERIGFGVTVILSFSVYLIVISDKLPEKSDKSPLLGILYVLIFYILVFSFVISTINARLYFNKHRPPNWLLNLARGSKRNWSFTFGKKIRKIKVKAFNGQETKKEECFDVDEMDRRCETSENHDKESFSEQWQSISSYLDKLCLKIVIALVAIAPWIVVQMLQRVSKNY